MNLSALVANGIAVVFTAAGLGIIVARKRS